MGGRQKVGDTRADARSADPARNGDLLYFDAPVRLQAVDESFPVAVLASDDRVGFSFADSYQSIGRDAFADEIGFDGVGSAL